MQTRYDHLTDKELLGYREIITNDPELIEELWNRLEVSIENPDEPEPDLTICAHCGDPA